MFDRRYPERSDYRPPPRERVAARAQRRSHRDVARLPVGGRRRRRLARSTCSRTLVLSHYDAKAHLVVARRVIDNLTPGWRQIGAVWLPLPHLLQMLPVQVDLLYRTGAFGSLVSIASFGRHGLGVRSR